MIIKILQNFLYKIMFINHMWREKQEEEIENQHD